MSGIKRIIPGLVAALVLLPAAGCAAVSTLGSPFAVARAEYNLLRKDNEEARRLAHEILARDPDNERARLVLGWSEYRFRDYGSARTAFAHVHAKLPDNAQAAIGLGWSNLHLGDPAAARRFFLEARGLTNEWDQMWDIADGLGWVAFTNGDMKAAVTHFSFEPVDLDTVKAESHDTWQLHYEYWAWQKEGLLGRGWVALWRDDLVAARDLFEKGIDQDADLFRLYDGLARVALFEGRNGEALRQTLIGIDKSGDDPDLILLLGAILERIADPKKSLRVYTRLAGRHSKVAAYHVGVGQSRLALGRLRGAERAFMEALKADSANVFAKVGLGKTLTRMNLLVDDGWTPYFAGDYEAALAIFQTRRDEAARTANPTAETGRGWALLSLGRAAEAGAAFRAALKIDRRFTLAKEGVDALRHHHFTLYLQAWTLSEAGKFMPARKQFLRARTLAPAKFQWQVDDGLAWLALYQKDLDGAEQAFRRILRRVPGAYMSRKGLGYVALKRGHYRRATENLLASLRQQSDQVELSYTYSSVLLLGAGEFDAARRILELGAKVYPASADIPFLLAKAYKGLGDAPTAARKAARSAKRRPAYIDPAFDDIGLEPAAVKDVYVTLANGLYFAGDNAGAVKRINDHVAAGGRDPAAYRIRGFALYRLGRYEDAAADLTMAAAQEPGNLAPVTELVPIPDTDQLWRIVYDARSTLAWSHYLRGDARRAVDGFVAVLRTNGKWIDAYTGLGYALLSLGDREGAVRSFRRALLISPGYPDAWQGLAKAR